MTDLASELARHIRPGDHVFWGQGAGEPLTLTEAIVAQRHALKIGNVFVGAAFSNTLLPGCVDGLPVSSYGTIGKTRQLAAKGLLEIIPCNLSRLGRAIGSGEIRCDVAVVQFSAPGPSGQHSMGPTNDYIRAAMEQARVVLIEVNAQSPWTYGPPPPEFHGTRFVIETSRQLVQLEAKPSSAVENAIGRHIASLVPDGATLQIGIGGTIDAMLESLQDRRDLGIHSGAIGDGVLSLIEKGVITNARKAIDTGKVIAANLFGTDGLFAFGDRNASLELHPYDYTHNAAILAQLPNLIAINSAVEVDLTGQINAELTGERYVGAVGGQVDFMHAATRAPKGFSVIALPSTAIGGRVSRIKPSLSTVTCARCEVDFLVTEHGVADLRMCALTERKKRILAIADPAFQDALQASAEYRNCA